jgi:uncharacterized protein YdaU (DUF1376 family)
MPLYVGDYLRDTGGLTAGEHGAYLLLIMQAWTRNGELPADDERLRRMAHMDAREWKHSGPTIMAFFTRHGDSYRHKRIDHELAKTDALVAQRSAAGKASAEARKRQRGGGEDPNGGGNGCSTGVEREPQQTGKPSPSQLQEPPSPPSVVRSPRGSRLWPEWNPSPEDEAFAAGLGLAVGAVADQFRDYWIAKSGKDAAKLDWSATWRGWCRREAENAKRRAPQAKPSKLAWFFDEMAAEREAAPIIDADEWPQPTTARLVQ